MSKVDQINELLHGELAMAVNQELEWPEALITISYVHRSPDLQIADIGVSVLPDNLKGTALKKLKAHSGKFAQLINRRTRLRKAPKLLWQFDSTEKEAAELEEIFLKIEQE